jgi:Flp pilus assembly protein TadD
LYITFNNPLPKLKKNLKPSGLLLAAARILEWVGLEETSLRLVRRVLQTDSRRPELHFWAGRLCFKTGLTDQAVSHFRAAWPTGWDGKLIPERFVGKKKGVPRGDNAWMLAAIGGWLLQRGEPARALAFLNRAISGGCRGSAVLNLKGLCLLATGSTTESLRLFREAMLSGGNNAHVCLNTALAFSRLGRHDKALPLYERAQRLGAKGFVVLNNKGYSLYSLKRYEEAAGCFISARDEDPSDATAEANIGACYLKLGRLKDAERHIGNALLKSPNDPVLLNNMAFILQDRGQRTEALDLFKKAAAAAGDMNEVYLLNQAACLVELGRYEEALSICVTLGQSAPGDRRVWSLKASILADLGRRREAADCYRRALGLTG